MVMIGDEYSILIMTYSVKPPHLPPSKALMGDRGKESSEGKFLI